MQYVLTTSGSISAGEHYFEFSGFPLLKIKTVNSGLHTIKLWLSNSATPGPGSYYYTFYWFSPSSSGTSSITGYGQGTSDKSFLELSMTPKTGMDFIFIEFFSHFTAGLGYPLQLGTGLNDGSYISGISKDLTTSKENCVLRVSTTALLSAVFCQAPSPSDTNSQTFYLANIQNPSSATTAFYQGYSMSFSSSSTNVHSFIQGSLSITSSSSSTISAVPSISTTIVQDTATWTFTSMIDSVNLSSGDKFFVDFTNNRPAYQMSTVVINAGITSHLVFTKTPAI